MATVDIRDQLYPFSTEDNKPIPLDIIRPVGLIKQAFVVGTLTDLVVPAAWKLASFYSPSGCIIQFASTTLVDPIEDGEEYADSLLVPPNCVVTSTVIVGTAKILALGSSAGYVIAQNIQKWAGLSLNRKVATI